MWMGIFAEMQKDHDRGEVIWNAGIRSELQDVIERELQLFWDDRV